MIKEGLYKSRNAFMVDYLIPVGCISEFDELVDLIYWVDSTHAVMELSETFDNKYREYRVNDTL